MKKRDETIEPYVINVDGHMEPKLDMSHVRNLTKKMQDHKDGCMEAILHGKTSYTRSLDVPSSIDEINIAVNQLTDYLTNFDLELNVSICKNSDANQISIVSPQVEKPQDLAFLLAINDAYHISGNKQHLTAVRIDEFLKNDSEYSLRYKDGFISLDDKNNLYVRPFNSDVQMFEAKNETDIHNVENQFASGRSAKYLRSIRKIGAKNFSIYNQFKNAKVSMEALYDKFIRPSNTFGFNPFNTLSIKVKSYRS